MKNVGYIIRGERVRQGIKQSNLARGICTPSYLSRIENELVDPSEEITTLLLKRLSVDETIISNPSSKNKKELYEALKLSYSNVISKRNKSFTIFQLETITRKEPLFKKIKPLYYMYLLIHLRFRLAIREDLSDIEKEIEVLKKMAHNFNSIHKYLFLINQAIYYFDVENTKKSIQLFEEALGFIDELNLEDWEKADFNYMIGLAYADDNQSLLSIKYINKSLNFFTEHFIINRALDCYMILGVVYKRNGQFNLALEIYSKAQQLCIEFNIINQLGIIYHNLGSLFAKVGESEKGIEYFLKSLDAKNESSEKIITILSLIKEYSKKKNKKMVLYWCDKGTAILKDLNKTKSTKFSFHFNFYKSLYSEKGLSEELAKNTISYFEKCQDYKNARKYCIAVAKWFIKQKKYKLASIYFENANEQNFIDLKIVSWEDL